MRFADSSPSLWLDTYGPYMPEPLRMGVAAALRGYLRAEDWFNERDLAAP
jgi:hypothetical protein